MIVSIIMKYTDEREFVYANVTKFDYNKTQGKIRLFVDKPAEMYVIQNVKEVEILSL